VDEHRAYDEEGSGGTLPAAAKGSQRSVDEQGTVAPALNWSATLLDAVGDGNQAHLPRARSEVA